jgi:hypothetical protein
MVRLQSSILLLGLATGLVFWQVPGRANDALPATSGESAKLLQTSGPARVPLLELYSSEGCSSCPPADAWVSGFKGDPNLWKSVVPVVFHVDYWNYLGWKDRFSSKDMTQRQKDLTALWDSPKMYTPGVLVDGLEWTGWRQARNRKIPNLGEPQTHMILSLYKNADLSYTVKVSGHDPSQQYVVRWAQLGMNESTDVKNGENSGQVLQHNFVVLHWDHTALSKTTAKTVFRLPPSTAKPGAMALAVWIEREGNPRPLQAVGVSL